MRLFWTYLFLSVTSFLLLPLLFFAEKRMFEEKEVYFSSPVSVSNGTILIRTDSRGRGYFGVSRNGGRYHKGIDLIARLGGPIFAAKSGRVLFSGQQKGYGNYVEIIHPDGHKSAYAHLLNLQVATGDWVRQNAILGGCGKSGNADHPKITPHVHFEIKKNGQVLDPSSGLIDPGIQIR